MTGLFPGKRYLPAEAEEVIASDSSVRIASFGRVPHYPVSDTRGNDAKVEFIDAKTVSHSGKNLPVTRPPSMRQP